MDNLNVSPSEPTTCLVYLARGADQKSLDAIKQFAQTYPLRPATLKHDLLIVLKGFRTQHDLQETERLFDAVPHRKVHLGDENFDIGAYREAVILAKSEQICFLNTFSVPQVDHWLLKLSVNLNRPGVGIVGATGSFEAHRGLHPKFPDFPNVHIRTNAFMMRTIDAGKILSSYDVRSKLDAHLAESGDRSVTRQISELGYSALIVGRNGRGYPPERWSQSATFRQGQQENILVSDNATQYYDKLTWAEKKAVHQATWAGQKPP